MMNARRLILFLTGISLISLLGLAVCKDTSSTTAGTQRFQPWGDGRSYLLGVNYPWLHYGHDFGTTAWGHDGASAGASTTQIDADFAYLKNQGVHVVRWFLFGDCRASPEFDANGNVTGFDEHFYPDLDAALAIAEKHEVYLAPVLLDHLLADDVQSVNGVRLFGRSEVISDPAKRLSFLNNALRPLLQRYGQDRNIIAWDVMNEPEGAMSIPGGKWVGQPVSATAMQSFVKDIVGYIHTYSSQHATVGSASRRFLHYWRNSELNLYQYHYYDNMESQYPLDYPCADLKLDRPCIVGEFPTKNTKRTMTQYLDTIWNNGYAGALAWSYRAGDEVSGFRGVASEFNVWLRKHKIEPVIPLLDAGWKPEGSIANDGGGRRDGKLHLKANLTHADDYAELFLDLRSVQLPGIKQNREGSYNLAGMKLVAFVRSDQDFRGEWNAGNGAQFLVKDKNWKSLVGPWLNVTHAMESETGMEVFYKIPDAEISRNVAGISLKFTINSESRATYKGSFFVNTVRIEMK